MTFNQGNYHCYHNHRFNFDRNIQLQENGQQPLSHNDVDMETTARSCSISSTRTTVTISYLKNVIIEDVLMNLADTLSRLVETREYEEWLRVYQIQKSNAIL